MAGEKARLEWEFALPPEDIAAITRSSVDYIESWYTANGERMRQCLHPDLAKRTVKRDPGTGGGGGGDADGPTPGGGKREGPRAETPAGDRTYRVSILDVFRNTASVKVVSHPFVDYLHLARFNNRWLIVNALWEPRQQKA